MNKKHRRLLIGDFNQVAIEINSHLAREDYSEAREVAETFESQVREDLDHGHYGRSPNKRLINSRFSEIFKIVYDKALPKPMLDITSATVARHWDSHSSARGFSGYFVDVRLGSQQAEEIQQILEPLNAIVRHIFQKEVEIEPFEGNDGFCVRLDERNFNGSKHQRHVCRVVKDLLPNQPDFISFSDYEI